MAAHLDKADQPHHLLIPDQYTESSMRQKQAGLKVISENYQLLSSLGPPPVKLLDIGCGPGEMDRVLALFTNISQIVGMDANPLMVNYSNENNKNKKIHFFAGNIENLGSMTFDHLGQFDVITSFAMLNWMQDIKKALGNIKQCLKPGGYLVGHYTCHSDRQGLRNMIYSSEKWKPYLVENSPLDRNANKSWTQANGDEVFRSALEETGFHIIKCEKETMTYYQKLEEAERAAKIFIERHLSGDIEPKLKEQFIKEVFELQTKDYTKHEGFYELKSPRVFFVAKS